jgi:hypothetical protein
MKPGDLCAVTRMVALWAEAGFNCDHAGVELTVLGMGTMVLVIGSPVTSCGSTSLEPETLVEVPVFVSCIQRFGWIMPASPRPVEL